MSALPTGTVTFLFTDIAGSTRLWEQYPDAMKPVLARHDAILRHAVEANHGHMVKTTGDGIHAVFKMAASGLAAALAAQQALLAEPWEEIRPQSVRVRMGLHTGEAEIRLGDYYGPTLNRAARLMALGNGGQILVSNVTAEVAREALPGGASLQDLGEHRLKDLARPEHIYQLAHPSLPSEFPPIQSSDTIPNNLPVQLTRFIGRARETSEIVSLLGAVRLVTLTGSGGTGKTRLAQEASSQVLAHFPQGAWWVELAPLATPSQIMPALAQIFGLKELPAMPLSTLVTEYLRPKEALLILDNCEHLVDACAQLADDLLHQCPRLKIIASSREALGIAGEVAYRIPSLEDSEAVQLFVDRAQAVHPKFQLSEQNGPAITRICSRLDGIPLAIELAAARVKLLSADQIAARLDDRFRLLIGGSRTALPRQQTLRALIDWSYDLLSEAERRTLRIASVFVGGWSLDALEAVAQDPDTLEHLEQLVNKSLVVAEERENEMRYSLLETIRQYAREKLFDSGEREAIRIRDLHLDFYLKLTESAEPRLFGSDMIDALKELELEQDNLRAALEWASENDPLAALRMAAVLAFFWARIASPSEGYTQVKAALDHAQAKIQGEGATALAYLRARSKALIGEANLALQLGKNHPAQAAIESAVSLARQINDTQILAWGLGLGAVIHGFVGDVSTGRAWAEESIALSRQYEYPYALATTVGTSMFLSLVANQPIPAGLVEEMIRAARDLGNPWVLGMAISNIGRVASYTGQLDEANEHFKEAMALFLKIGDRTLYTANRSEMGHVFRKQGRYAEAVAIYHETMPVFQEMGQWAAFAHELECLAFIAGTQRQGERAAKLLGAAEALRERINSAMTLIERREYEQALDHLRAQLDKASLEKAWAEGRALTMDQALEFATKDTPVSIG